MSAESCLRCLKDVTNEGGLDICGDCYSALHALARLGARVARECFDGSVGFGGLDGADVQEMARAVEVLTDCEGCDNCGGEGDCYALPEPLAALVRELTEE